MRKKTGFILLLVIVAILPLAARAVPDLVKEGVADFRFKELTTLYPLCGEWKFQSEDNRDMFLSVPGGWEEKAGYNIGRGIYYLTILNDHRMGGEAALLLPKLNQNIRVYVNGRLAFDSISVGSTILRFNRSIIPLPTDRDVKIIILVDNSYYSMGGMHHAILYGPYNRVLQYKYRNMIKEAAISGILFFMFLYNLFLFLSRYSERSSFYLALLSLVFSFRGLLSGEVIAEMMFPRIHIGHIARWDIALIYLGILFILFFIRNVFAFQKIRIRRIINLLALAGGLFALLSLVLPLPLVSSSVYFLYFYGFAVFSFSLYLIARRIGKENSDALIIFIGGILFMVLVSADIYSIQRGVIMRELTQTGVLFFLLSDFIVVTRKFGRSYLQADKLSRELEVEVALQTKELKQLSRTDSLTGINNRRRFMELGQREILIHQRKERPLSLLMMDLDHFKKVNDRFGHSVGDKALVVMVGLCQEEIRQSDILGRLGGEEFALILPETDLRRAREIAERIRSRLEESTKMRDDGVPPMTVSIGVIGFESEETLDGGLERADEYLYKAKKGGRNRVSGPESA
ncbi:MAG: diguanylate cyclase [Spirochaetales bacterium]|nr:diguanylate cyclase [Spirochaetales bacterium]